MKKECQTLFFNSVNFELFSCCNGTKVTEVYCIESVPLPQHFMIACVLMLFVFATHFCSELSYVVWDLFLNQLYCYILYSVYPIVTALVPRKITALSIFYFSCCSYCYACGWLRQYITLSRLLHILYLYATRPGNKNSFEIAE